MYTPDVVGAPQREGRQGISERQVGLTAQADSPRSRRRKNLGKPDDHVDAMIGTFRARGS